MARVVSLRSTLVRQWVAFTLGVTLLLSLVGTVGLYIVEDHFFNRRLAETARTIPHLVPSPALPAGFTALVPEQLPEALKVRMLARKPGTPVELWTPEGRYIHALRTSLPSGQEYVLIHDVTDELTVNEGLKRYAPFVVGTLLTFLLGAWFLARSFAGRVQGQFEELVSHLQLSETPGALAAYASETNVEEFRWLAEHSAKAWAEKLEAVAQERETLLYLAHEMASPLQAARASLELLEESPDATLAKGRLHRAVARLERVSRSIKWLESGPAPTREGIPSLGPLVEALLIEFKPLGERRGVGFRLEVTEDGPWPVPREVLETLLANLLLNALQHGQGPEVAIHIASARVRVENARAPESIHGGTGLGLRIVQRWAERFGLLVAVEGGSDGRFTVQVVHANGSSASV